MAHRPALRAVSPSFCPPDVLFPSLASPGNPHGLHGIHWWPLILGGWRKWKEGSQRSRRGLATIQDFQAGGIRTLETWLPGGCVNTGRFGPAPPAPSLPTLHPAATMGFESSSRIAPVTQNQPTVSPALVKQIIHHSSINSPRTFGPIGSEHQEEDWLLGCAPAERHSPSVWASQAGRST